MKKMKFALVSISIMGVSVSLQAAQPTTSPELIAKGKAAYAKNCVICHGEKGDGTGVAAAALNPKPRDFTHGDYKKGGKPGQLFETITRGIPGTGMASFAQLPEADRWSLAYYVQSLKK